eukprot:264715_1
MPAWWWAPSLILSLFLMMCALASAVDVNAFVQKLKKPKGIFIGLICQYGFLPAMAYGLCHLFNFDYESSIALILTATCPGGLLSNFFAFTIGADLPLSIAMTTASSVLSFAFIPLNCFLYIQLGLNNPDGVSMDWSRLFISIIVIIIGVVVGLLLAWKKVKTAQRILAPLATLSLIYLIIVSLYDNFTSKYPLWTLSWTFYIAPLTLTVIGWISGLCFALLWKMPKSSAVSVGIETSNQSTGVAIAILALTVSDPDTYFRVVTVPGIYTLLTWIVNGIAVVLFLKLGWVNEDRDGDQSVTCCTLIERYKRSKEKGYECPSEQGKVDELVVDVKQKNIEIVTTSTEMTPASETIGSTCSEGKDKTNVVDGTSDGISDQSNESDTFLNEKAVLVV